MKRLKNEPAYLSHGSHTPMVVSPGITELHHHKTKSGVSPTQTDQTRSYQVQPHTTAPGPNRLA